ncbi:hypothetical protein WMY93_004593 [Mugilogobius chulae]|uniref:MIR domain-containing protein n=1 Tax=Mugilogobius chulae TaxID=88201 RepID=A0AAW0PP53_9GOBI
MFALFPGHRHDAAAALHAPLPASLLALLPLALFGSLWPGSDARDPDASAYGSGSGQQSVTGVDAADDANSYWQVRGKAKAPCVRGTPVKCGQQVRLTHMKTGRNLHSHHFSSPLSNHQEVSAFGERGEGDDLDVWAVQCDGDFWERDDSVRLKHVGTDVFLSVTGETYGHPIRGQREVHGMSSPGNNGLWRAMEGVFIQPSLEPMGRHDEL